MRVLSVAGVLIAASIAPAVAGGGYDTTEDFLTQYGNGSNIYARLFIRGVGEGIGMTNVLVKTDGGTALFCPPPKLALVDAQYVSIVRSFIAKFPKTKSEPVAAVLLFALKDAFPCN